MKLRRFSQFFDQYFSQFPAFDFRPDENALWLFGFVKSGDGVAVVHHIKAEETAAGINKSFGSADRPVSTVDQLFQKPDQMIGTGKRNICKAKGEQIWSLHCFGCYGVSAQIRM